MPTLFKKDLFPGRAWEENSLGQLCAETQQAEVCDV